jgi:methionine synthase II (cobalamin-independent)
MKSLKKENDDLNRKLHDLQDRMAKSVDHLEYRHSKFNELEAKVVEMFRGQPHSEEIERLRKLWEEYVDYVKTRDKKIKAMEDQIRKKDK